MSNQKSNRPVNMYLLKSSKYIIIDKPKDRQATYQVVEQDIRLLTAEIYRLSKLPYSSLTNQQKLIGLDNQIQYLESLLAAYEKDQKGME